MAIMNIFNEKLVLPISDLLTGQNVYQYLQLFKKTASWPESKIQMHQNELFRRLIRHAINHVPFYRDLSQQNNYTQDDFQTTADLIKLPILDKTKIRQIGQEQFVSEAISPKDRISSHSSGSTGEPFKYFVSKEAYSMNTAAKLFTWYQAGYRLGDKYLKIANSPRRGLVKKIQDPMNNCIYMPFFSMNDEKIASILDVIERKKPTIIRAYPVPLYLIARYRNAHPGYKFCPNYIMTTGSTLPQDYRDEIETAFGCKIIDSYSCEGTPNTYQTPGNPEYTVTKQYGIIEVLDDKDQPVTNGIGHVVSTDLWNLAQPFIRYNTQDMVEVRDGKIVRIMGRECESFINAEGYTYTVHDFSGFFKGKGTPIFEAIEAYQVVRKKDGSIQFNIVPTDKYQDDMSQYITSFWQERLKQPISVVIVDEIPLMKNNKRRTIIDE